MAQLPLDATSPGTLPEDLSRPLAPLLPQKAPDEPYTSTARPIDEDVTPAAPAPAPAIPSRDTDTGAPRGAAFSGVPINAPRDPEPPASTRSFVLDPTSGKLKPIHQGQGYTVGPNGKVDMANSPALAGMNGKIPLSDGSFIFVPASTGEPEARAMQATVNDFIDHEGQLIAKKQGGPYLTPGKTYSASHVYGNSTPERIFAGLDHLGQFGDDQSGFSGVGNFLNKNVADPLNATHLLPYGLTNATFGDAGEGLARAAANRAGYIWDIPAGIGTALKHGLRPDLGTKGDPPLISSTIMQQLGIQPASSDQWWLPRLAEAGAAGGRGSLLNPAAAVRGGTRAAIAEGVGNVGANVAGAALGPQYRELGQQGGSLIGAGLPVGPAVSRVVAGRVRGAEAPATFRAGVPPEDPNNPSPPRTFTNIMLGRAQPEDTVANARSLMDPQGQRISNWMSSVPIFGENIREDNERAFSHIQNEKNASAAIQAGGAQHLSPDRSAEAIGEPLIQGARIREQQLEDQKQARYAPVHAQMGPNPAAGRPFGENVDVGPVEAGLHGRVSGNAISPHTEAALRDFVYSHLTSAAPGGENYDTARGPVPPGQGIPSIPGTPASAGTPASPGFQGVPGPMNIPWPLSSSFVSDAVAGLPPTGPLRAAQVRDANVVRDVLNAQEAAADRVNSGLGQQFRDARTGYRMDSDTQRTLYPLSGMPSYDDQGNRIYTPVGAGDAARVIRGNRQNSERIAPFAEQLGRQGNTDYWGRASGNYINTWGETPQGFNPRIFSKMEQSHSGPVMAELTRQPGGGGLTEAYQRLRNASQMGRNYDVAPEGSGLVHASGTGASVLKSLSYLRSLAERFGGFGAAAEMVPATAIHVLSRGVTSPTFKRALGEQPVSQDVAHSIYQGYPVAGAVNDQEREQMLRNSPAGRAAGMMPSNPR